MFSRLSERLKYLFFDVENDWEMGISLYPIGTFLTDLKMPPIQWLTAPRGAFWADPFAIFRDDKYYIFYEEYEKDKGYATINCMTLDSKLKELDRRIIIDEGYHFSFPFVFDYAGYDYMLPETCAVGKLILYKAERFPFDWKQEKVVLNIPCIDSVLFFREGYWWLMYSKAQSENGNGICYLRKNKQFLEGWEDCPELTISNGTYNSRGGGSVFDYKGDLYRVTQNCTNSYGQSVVINKITNLSDTDFAEKAVRELSIDSSDVRGFHTLSACGNVSMVDRRREILYLKSPMAVLASIGKKLKSK